MLWKRHWDKMIEVVSFSKTCSRRNSSRGSLLFRHQTPLVQLFRTMNIRYLFIYIKLNVLTISYHIMMRFTFYHDTDPCFLFSAVATIRFGITATETLSWINKSINRDSGL